MANRLTKNTVAEALGEDPLRYALCPKFRVGDAFARPCSIASLGV